MGSSVEEFESHFRGAISSAQVQEGLRVALAGAANQLDPKLRVSVFAARGRACVGIGKRLMVAVVPADPIPYQFGFASGQVVGKLLGRNAAPIERDFLAVVLGALASHHAGGPSLVGYFMNYLQGFERAKVADLPAAERGRAAFLLALSEGAPKQPDLESIRGWVGEQSARWADETVTGSDLRALLDDQKVIRTVKELCEMLSTAWAPSPR